MNKKLSPVQNHDSELDVKNTSKISTNTNPVIHASDEDIPKDDNYQRDYCQKQQGNTASKIRLRYQKQQKNVRKRAKGV